MERDVARFGMLLEDAEVALMVDDSGFDAKRRKANLVSPGSRIEVLLRSCVLLCAAYRSAAARAS